METHDNGEIIINDDCSIAQNFHITSSELPLVIGAKTTILGNVFITNIDHEYKNIDQHIMEQPMITKEQRLVKTVLLGLEQQFKQERFSENSA